MRPGTALAQPGEGRSGGFDAEFAVVDALRLERLVACLATVLDCGLFHSFDGEERRVHLVASLASVCEPGTALYVLCFSDARPDTRPSSVSQDELKAAFRTPQAGALPAVQLPTGARRGSAAKGAPAWLAEFERV